jgi:hypothetical protein
MHVLVAYPILITIKSAKKSHKALETDSNGKIKQLLWCHGRRRDVLGLGALLWSDFATLILLWGSQKEGGSTLWRGPSANDIDYKSHTKQKNMSVGAHVSQWKPTNRPGGKTSSVRFWPYKNLWGFIMWNKLTASNYDIVLSSSLSCKCSNSLRCTNFESLTQPFCYSAMYMFPH